MIIYLFYFVCAGSWLLRGLSLVAESRDYHLVVVPGFSLQQLLLLWCTKTLEHIGSAVVVHGLSWPAVWGNLLRPGIEPVSSVLAGRFLTTGPPGKSSLLLFNTLFRT